MPSGIKKLYPGNATTLARVFEIAKSEVSPYLRQYVMDPELKAFPGDEHTLMNNLVYTDFLRRIGITLNQKVGPGKWLGIYNPSAETRETFLQRLLP